MCARYDEKDWAQMDRRTFLRETGRWALFAFGASMSGAIPLGTVDAAPQFSDYPFTLGVASGDPHPDGMVLWTRLAPKPLQGGGMPRRNVTVRWEVAKDEAFSHVVRKGTAVATPRLAHSVHVEVTGLRPSTTYFYRFMAGKEISQVGRTRTAPPTGAPVSSLRFAFASCQQFEHGWYTAYRHMAREDLDFIIHLGDYIYEHGIGRYKAKSGLIRKHNGPEPFTLEEYRNRYALYRSDPHLRAAHAAFPWIVTWDDHEVENNYADIFPQRGQSVESFIRRRAAAYQAYYEHMPLRISSLPKGPDMQLYRRLIFGNLAAFHVLDTRQYRDDQVKEGYLPPNPESLDPSRTLLGSHQERWLKEGLTQSPSHWNILAQQVFFSQLDIHRGPGQLFNMDAWDGYAASRNRLLHLFSEGNINNPVILTGDVHANWTCELKANFQDPDSPIVGTEFVGTSITSDGDGSDQRADTAWIRSKNPHVRFFNDLRGYVRCELDHRTWRTDYRVVPYVSRPGAPVHTRASFVVEAGNPGVHLDTESRIQESAPLSDRREEDRMLAQVPQNMEQIQLADRRSMFP
ncbi:alkaline phosphatase D [Marinithermofilum abyssi]|uniref:Alkaline phosphatase D n=1 Tax=Marinithermofilum abyssi TaxID=1571185 RepID=A0A8J2VKM8_9BACL|nr:alkaline phosphatase D family protein [Marinithermofilum abyssi]GGE29731.1 alkaline phosphatase D [Marinithermofilum abyssi]